MDRSLTAPRPALNGIHARSGLGSVRSLPGWSVNLQWSASESRNGPRRDSTAPRKNSFVNVCCFFLAPFRPTLPEMSASSHCHTIPLRQEKHSHASSKKADKAVLFLAPLPERSASFPPPAGNAGPHRAYLQLESNDEQYGNKVGLSPI